MLDEGFLGLLKGASSNCAAFLVGVERSTATVFSLWREFLKRSHYFGQTQHHLCFGLTCASALDAGSKGIFTLVTISIKRAVGLVGTC